MLAIVSLSARSLIFSAKKTFKNLIALDVFGDIETIECSDYWFCIGKKDPFPKIDPIELIQKLKLASSMGCKAWVAGSGFEGNTSLLIEAEKILPRYGMSIETLDAVRNPNFFFKILKKFNLPFPKISYTNKNFIHDDKWLWKDLSSCGGMGINKNNYFKKNDTGFFQKKINGISMSVSIISNGKSGELIGFCKLINFSFKGFPYLHSGLLGPVSLPNLIQKRMQNYISILIREFKLVGFFGIDFILDKNNSIFILEVNPRPTASLEILDKYYKNSLFKLHCQSTIKELMVNEKIKLIENNFKKLSGQRTVYALKSGMLNKKKISDINQLSFTTDCPSVCDNFLQGQPICSVVANGIDENSLSFDLYEKCLTVNKILF